MQITITPKDIKRNKIFPQSNNIYILIKFLDNKTNFTKREHLKNINIEIHERQVQYYNDALEYLCLFNNGEATKLGHFIMSFDLKFVYASLVKLILEDPIFYDYYKNKDLNRTSKLIKSTYEYSISTSNRRSSTVKNWITWCETIINDFNIRLNII